MRPIQFYDTTLRDGAQGEGISFSLQDKLLITERLAEMGFDFVEGGYPLSNEKDAQYFERVRDLDLGNTQICAFGMTRRRGISVSEDPGMLALVNSQSPVVTVVGKTWDFHATDVLRVTLDDNLEMLSDSVQFLKESGRRVIYDAEHFLMVGSRTRNTPHEPFKRRLELGPSSSCCVTRMAAAFLVRLPS